MLSPKVGQGYLVLNKAEYPSVEAWSVILKERTFDSNGVVKDATLDKITLKNNINYWRVPNKYLDSESLYFVEVSGTDGNGSAVITDAPLVVSKAPSAALEEGGTPFLYGCKWTCNGSYSAWEIQQYVNPDLPLVGLNRLEVRTAYNFNEALQQATPIYRYITEGEYSDNCGSGQPFFLYDVPCYPDGIWMTEPITVPFGSGASVYLDLNGQQIAGGTSVRGVGKPLGDWGGGQPITTPELNFGMDQCGNDTWWAMGVVNNNAPSSNGYPMDGTGNNFYPELACNGNTTSGVEGASGTDPCIGNAWDVFIGSDPTDDAWGTFVNAVIACTRPDGEGDGSVLSWQEQIDKCNIHNLNDPTAPIIEIDPNDAQTFSNGFTLQSGLYDLGFAIKGIGYVPMIFEVEKKLTVSMALADLLSVTIYPVPITDDKFSIDMTAADALKFTYEFRNDSGVLLYTENFNLKKGQQWTHVVEPKQGVPTGMHINRFIFEDGSVLALQTIK